jgi:hypothetical protein
MNGAGAQDIDRSSKKDGPFYSRRVARPSLIILRNAMRFSRSSSLLVAIPASALHGQGDGETAVRIEQVTYFD